MSKKFEFVFKDKVMKMEKGKKKIDWREIRASFIAIFAAYIVKHYIFTEELIHYSLWKDFLLFVAVYIPVYVLLLFLQGRFKTKDK
mgnify:CR=1 FL=1